MNADRREFLKRVTRASAGAAALSALDPAGGIPAVEAASRLVAGVSPKALARDESFWLSIRKAFHQSSSFINLESGWFSAAPTRVLDAQVENLRHLNGITSFYLRRPELWPQAMADLKTVIGKFAGVPPEEFVVTRNTTESLNIVIQGLQLADGDEILYGDREYPSVTDALEQRAERYGTKLRTFTAPMVPRDDAEVVSLYQQNLTPRTKVIVVSHMIFLTGQILPVRQICDMAHARGIEVVVDAAHSFAHLDYKIPDLGCDYLGTSLHKWLCVPIGTGLLYVKKEKIAKVWPLLGDRLFPKDDIRKFEHLGTHPVSTDLVIRDAIRFHESIGSKRKEERLRYLKNYWVEQVIDIPGVKINTPLGDGQSCAIANVAVDGIAPEQLAKDLFDAHRVFTVAVKMGVRVSPNLFNTLADLDALVAGIRQLAAGRGAFDS
jgi:selenocysteine lyase/cysteine desulfurase